MNSQKIYQAALAGLLHDIGKFAQRAEEQVSAEWSEGKTRKDFKYQHALHTWHFINKYVPEKFGVGVLAAYHHAPQDAAQRCIRLADQLSAGERDSGEDRDDSDRAAHPKQLHPIFTRIRVDGKQHSCAGKEKFYLPLEPLALQKDVVFPQEKPLAKTHSLDAVWGAYKEMWEAFCREAEELKNLKELPAYVEAMQALLQRYAWCIPSAYFKSVPDISLYDHSRMTAALAVCLDDFDDKKIEALNRDWQAKGEGGTLWNEPVALLVGGDISGVQKFIYTISSKGAAKALRGRSFYLQLLTEAVLRFVLRELGLPYTNVIYSGGGHFFLLAPLSAKKELPKIQAAISQKLLKHHGTALYLALGSAEVPLRGFQTGAFTEYWDAMHKNLQEAKSRRYTELGAKMHDLVFAVPEDGGGDKHCAVCGADDVHLTQWKEEGDVWICSQCRSYVEDLGKELPTTRYLHWRFGQAQDIPRGTFADALKAFGAQVMLLKEDGKADFQPGDALWALSDPEKGWPQGSDRAVRWLRYAVNQIPVVKDAQEAEEINKRLSASERKESPARPGVTKTFTHLQVQSGSGFERLGVVRLDVDNLGTVFKDGLGNKATLSRLSALSSQMSLFFEGWVKDIIARDGRDRLVYAVYAGGDDVFLIGPWEVMPDVALDIAKEFGVYTGHPGLHISGGMAFIHGKYPVYQAAEDAGAAESLAKNRGKTKKCADDKKGEGDKDEKNAFAFLNTAWRWDEFETLKENQETLRNLVQGTGEEGGSPKSLLMLLRTLAKMESEATECDGRPVWGRWMWMGAYHLTRAVERNKKKNPALVKALEYMSREFEQDNYKDLPRWGAAARWAQLLLRKKETVKGD